MPTLIYLSNGKALRVAEDPATVAGKIGDARDGSPIRFDAPTGDKTSLTYISPSQIVCFQETPEAGGHAPSLPEDHAPFFSSG